MDIAIEELRKMLKSLMLCNLLTLVACALFKIVNMRLLISLLLGNLYMAVNFIMIGMAAEAALELDVEGARRKMATEYFKRLFITTLVIIFGITADFINPLGLILPLFFPKASLYCGNIFWKGGENK